MNIILLGAPGAGKGTEASKIVDTYKLPHISTGDIFRENIKNQTPIGLLAKSYTDNGKLVPDEVTCKIVEERLSRADCANGYMLDGFPRTIAQAEALDKVATIDVVLDINVPFEAIINRLGGRLVCSCGETSHVQWVDSEKRCPKCGEVMHVRDDDKPETVRARLEVYTKLTAPLVEYYGKKGNLVSVDVSASDSVEEVFELVKKVL